MVEPQTNPAVTEAVAAEPAAVEPVAIIVDELEGPWWHLLIVYTRDWIHYGSLAFVLFLTVAAAVRGLLAR